MMFIFSSYCMANVNSHVRFVIDYFPALRCKKIASLPFRQKSIPFNSLLPKCVYSKFICCANNIFSLTLIFEIYIISAIIVNELEFLSHQDNNLKTTAFSVSEKQ